MRIVFHRQERLVHAAAFTLVELLVVMSIIVLLAGLLLTVGGKLLNSQRVAYTRQIMRTTELAIEQFSTQNPLGNIYDRRKGRTFGNLPPYQIMRPKGMVSAHVNNKFEPNTHSDDLRYAPASLDERLRRDIFGERYEGKTYLQAMRINGSSNAPYSKLEDYANDDNRALYTYLKIFAKGTIEQVPPNALKSLTNTPEYVNVGFELTKANPEPGTPDSKWIDIFGIHDAWGVPFDYFIMFRIEFGVDSVGETDWRVTDRIPVLRSYGVDAESYAQIRGLGTADAKLRDRLSRKSIFSQPHLQPEANGLYQNADDPRRVAFRDPNSGGQIDDKSKILDRAGWVRAVGAANKDATAGENYGFLP